MDVFGKALLDFHQSGRVEKLWLHNNYGKPEEMPVEVFFRPEPELSELEILALAMCKGKVLDIGAGAGALSLILQSGNINVTALEISAAACKIMTERGVRNVVNDNIYTCRALKYDTLLLMMNGIGLSGDINGLNTLLSRLKEFLSPGGQIILDSSDISYLYRPGRFPAENYYGEISYQYEYQYVNGDWFKWLYIDLERLKTMAGEHGFSCELVFDDGMDQYLARLSAIR